MLEPHAAFFTFAENLGHPKLGNPLPTASAPTRATGAAQKRPTSDTYYIRMPLIFTTIRNMAPVRGKREVHFHSGHVHVEQGFRGVESCGSYRSV